MLISLVQAPRWMLVCPCCGRRAAALHPPHGSGRPPVRAALEAEWSRRNERGEVTLPDVPGGIGWVCLSCRTGRRGSTASRMGPIDRLARAAGKADDPRRGMRRAGESWAQEARREHRIAKTIQELASLDGVTGRRLDALLGG